MTTRSPAPKPTPPRASAEPDAAPDEVKAAQSRNYYWRGQVGPRLHAIAWSGWFIAPISVGIVLPWILAFLAKIETPIADVAGFAMNYAAVGFGACITGSVLAISLPSKGRISTWAQTDTAHGFSGYSDLVFALTWAALAQLALIVVCVSALIIGGREDLLPGNPKESHTLLLGLSTAVFFYAVVQLFVLLQTISQLGNLIDFQERQGSRKADNGATAIDG